MENIVAMRQHKKGTHVRIIKKHILHVFVGRTPFCEFSLLPCKSVGLFYKMENYLQCQTYWKSSRNFWGGWISRPTIKWKGYFRIFYTGLISSDEIPCKKSRNLMILSCKKILSPVTFTELRISIYLMIVDTMLTVLNDYLNIKILDQFAIFALENIYLAFLRLKEFEG